ncbi:unnamed protein product [Acanthoscelides obtectus]|nr:unnamed protein product [Acanthoscelides obtectus]CAK1634043.1 hypothetical protein AOBTE_LOCUS8559 [Acanthoscelides obtectus]
MNQDYRVFIKDESTSEYIVGPDEQDSLQTCMMDNFDTEKFIIDIQNRPSIWDSSSADYSNRDLKKKCWEEIVDLYGGEGQTVEQKKDLGLVLQKRWKSIRSCYAREVKRQKNLKSGSGATNRKSEYIYFKQLQFLQKVVAIREKEDDVKKIRRALKYVSVLKKKLPSNVNGNWLKMMIPLYEL